jgi:hypothetical protein
MIFLATQKDVMFLKNSDHVDIFFALALLLILKEKRWLKSVRKIVRARVKRKSANLYRLRFSF